MAGDAADGVNVGLLGLEDAPKDVDRYHFAVLVEKEWESVLVLRELSGTVQLVGKHPFENGDEQVVEPLLVASLVAGEQLLDHQLLLLVGKEARLQQLYDIARVQLQQQEAVL